MRPVIKLPGNALAVTAFYTKATNFNFDVSPVKAYVQGKFNTTNPTALQCLTELQRIYDTPVNSRSPVEKKYMKAMSDRVGDEYKRAAVGLEFFLSKYCSYCETPVLQLVEVEHIWPKSTLTIYALDWDNFLIACGPCNNAKSNKPPRSDIQALIGHAPTPAEYKQAIRDYYVWPDTDASSYRWISYKLHSVTNGGTAALPVDQQISLGHKKVFLDALARTVTADILNPVNNVSTNRSVRVTATGTGGAGANPANADAARRIIELMQINTLRGEHSYDSRVLRKTECWFEALNAIKRIRRLKASTSSTGAYEDLWSQVMQTIEFAGFFSIWLTVFDAYPYLTRFNKNDYAAKFLSLVNDNNFKNTNMKRLP